jgi:hypothetical protein
MLRPDFERRMRRRAKRLTVYAAVAVIGGLIAGPPVLWVSLGGGALILAGAADVWWLASWLPRKVEQGRAKRTPD